MAKLTIGTGSFYLGSDRVCKTDFQGLRTISRGTHSEAFRCLEIPLSVGGSTMSWFKCTFKDVEIGYEKDSDGIMVFPGLDGQLYPSWNATPHASIIGLRHDHRPANIHHAFKECIIFEICNALAPLNLKKLRVDGGFSNDHGFIQLLSDCLKVEIVIERGTSEITAYGAALLGSGLKPEVCDYQTFYPSKQSHIGSLHEAWTAKREEMQRMLKFN